MDSPSDLHITYSSPTVYNVDLQSIPFSELLSTFSDEILQGCTSPNYESALVDYIVSIVEPVGWKAVWRSSKETSKLDWEYDFVVDVANVSLEKLVAEVSVSSIIITDSNPPLLKNLKIQLKNENSFTIPLVELYVISEDDDEELYEKTAIAIEHVRFFLTHLIRPWDMDDDVVYSEETIKPRLQLYFDMKNNVLPKTMISKVKSILKEGKRIQKELQQLFSDMNVSDSEAEINEDDLMKSMSLKKKLDKLQAKMEMIENPVIRSFVTKKFSPNQALRKRQKSHPVTYVVSKLFTSEMITKLCIDSKSVLEFEHNPEAAFKHSSTGDRIFIFPGVYQCDSLGWLEGDISVEGIGMNTDIVLEATGNSEVLLNCCAEKVELKNISLKAKAGLLSALVVHHGKIELKNCIINCNEAEMGILLLGGSEGLVEDSVICNSCEDGIQMRSLSNLSLKSSKVISSERHGIQIDAETGGSPVSFTGLNISGSHVTDNGGHGIFLCNVPISEISLQRPTGDFNILKLFPWLRYQIEESVMERNGEIGIGISSCANNMISSSPIKTLPFNTTTEEFNYSALSDLLNEVNLSADIQDSTLEKSV